MQVNETTFETSDNSLIRKEFKAKRPRVKRPRGGRCVRKRAEKSARQRRIRVVFFLAAALTGWKKREETSD
jgi:hypothetical protein